jgi:hypothetical protein
VRQPIVHGRDYRDLAVGRPLGDEVVEEMRGVDVACCIERDTIDGRLVLGQCLRRSGRAIGPDGDNHDLDGLGHADVDIAVLDIDTVGSEGDLEIREGSGAAPTYRDASSSTSMML